jgi:hypothetical protein
MWIGLFNLPNLSVLSVILGRGITLRPPLCFLSSIHVSPFSPTLRVHPCAFCTAFSCRETCSAARLSPGGRLDLGHHQLINRARNRRHELTHPPNSHREPEVSTQAPSSGPQVLPEISKERPGGQTKFKRIELPSVLCQHTAQQAPESGRISGEEDG